MVFNPGKYDRRITVQRPVATQNDYGEQVMSWVKVADLWAEKRDMRGMERFSAQQVRADIDTKFVIRYRSDISPVNRIVFDGKDYDIASVLEIGRREGLEILATARADT